MAKRVAAAVPDVDVVPIPIATDSSPDTVGDVLLTFPWGSANLPLALNQGVRWVHVLGTGVDAFPLQAVTGQLLTCSRGASAGPIAEWVLAVMLAFEKQLPESWIHSVPTEAWGRARLGTLDGKTLGIVGLGGIGVAIRGLTLDSRRVRGA